MRLPVRALSSIVPSRIAYRVVVAGATNRCWPLFSSYATTWHVRNKDDSADDGPIAKFVKEQIERGKIQRDSEQLRLAALLDELRRQICSTDANVVAKSQLMPALLSDAPSRGIIQRLAAAFKQFYLDHILSYKNRGEPRGIYIHGPVGVGKSFVMDLFYHMLQKEESSCALRRGIRRSHFNEFMLEVHQRIHQFKRQYPKADPLPAVASQLAREARILCFDEFQVTDIADAMILSRLLRMLWMEGKGRGIGMVVVATSNRAPDALYEGGLNRGLFVPFIATLKRHMKVVEMTGGKDYRRVAPTGHAIECCTRSYFWPAGATETRESLKQVFERDKGDEIELFNVMVPVRMGRTVRVPRSIGKTAWFDFEDLCANPLGAADYLAICESYTTLIVDKVPQLDGSRFNEARRFVTLIDAVYESKTRLVIGAQVALGDLFVGFDIMVQSNDGDEEIAVPGMEHETRTTYVKGEGGSSSSSSTTMMQTKDGEVEWSATGRIGVSLAQLSAVRDVSFSFERAESRLVEINNGNWGRAACRN